MPLPIAGLPDNGARVFRVTAVPGLPTAGPPLFCKDPKSGLSGLSVVPRWLVVAVKPVFPLPLPAIPIRLPPWSVKELAVLVASGPVPADRPGQRGERLRVRTHGVHLAG